MKKLRWQLLIIFVTGLVVGILLLGEQPQTPSPSATPVPVKGGVYSEALVGSMQRLNPLLNTNNAPDRDISRLIFSGLLDFDSNGAPQPDLAESWGYSKDGTIYTFTLRKNAKWHDGKPVTADDVVFTVGLMRKGGDVISSDVQDFWKDIEVVRLSDQVVQFRLPESFAPFPDYLTFGILPKHLLQGKTIDQIVDLNFNIQPVGSGPYQFDRLITENNQIKGVVLSAFKDYYGEKKPYIDQMVFRFYPDSQSAYQAYRNGEAQGISSVSADILRKVLAEPKLQVFTTRQPQLTMILFNIKSQEASFLQDADVRKALLTGLNRQGIIDRYLKGQAVVADGPILPGTWAYYNGLKQVSYDPDAAKTALTNAGYTLASDADLVRKKGDVALRLQLAYPDDDSHKMIAEVIQRNWTALGVEVTLEPLAYDSLLKDRLEQRNYQAALIDLNLSRTPDPDPYPFWDQAQATNGQNYTQWDNRIASEYLEEARVTVDLATRAKYYQNFQVLFSQELPALPLYYPVYTYAVDQEVQGVRVGPLFDTSDRFANVIDWFLTSRPKAENVLATAVKP